MNNKSDYVKNKHNLISHVWNYFISYSYINRKKRAISEIIVTLLLVAITVVGAILILATFSSTEALNISNAVVSSAESDVIGVKMIGFDTRDGNDISGISSLDNTNDGKLCATSSCDTEYVVLKIRTLTGFGAINSVTVNEVPHEWDPDTANQNIITGTKPATGKFSIVKISNNLPIIQSSSTVVEGNDIRIVIKLSDELNSNILMKSIIRITVTPTEGESGFFLVPAGATA